MSLTGKMHASVGSSPSQTLVRSLPTRSFSQARFIATKRENNDVVVASRGRGSRRTTVRCGDADEVDEWVKNTLGASVVKSNGMGSSSWASFKQLELDNGKKLFVKICRNRDADSMFAGEAEGLKAMHNTHTIRVPNVLHYGAHGPEGSFIVMEYLHIDGRYSQAELGTKLAQMHLAEPMAREAKDGCFGFGVNNTIGGTPQPNEWTKDWVEFYREKRIRHQVKLACDPELTKLGDKLCDKLGDYFEGVTVRPSILHGDLWSGNVCGVDGEPGIFDPACYYGHHEAEFGMSWCASFTGEFWAAYRNLIPKDNPGFEERQQIYLLYHYLNHYNLFGGGYYGTALSILRGLV